MSSAWLVRSQRAAGRSGPRPAHLASRLRPAPSTEPASRAVPAAAGSGAARELHGVTTSVVEPRPPRLTREDIKAEAEQMGQLDREAPLHPRQVAASPREYNAMLRLYKSRMSVLRKRYAQEWSARREREQAMLEARQAAWREARAAVKATRVEARAERIATHQRRQKRLRRARTVRQDMSRRRQGLWLLQVDRRQQAWLNALEADSQEWILEHEIDEKITADLFEEGRIPWQYREWFDNLARARAKDEAYARVAASSGAPGAQETEIEISDWEADMVAWESDAVEVGPAKAERDLVEIEDDITPLELAHGMDRKELRRRRAMRLRQYAAKYLLDEESEVLPPDYFSAISQRDAESVGKDVGAPGFFLLPEDIEQLKPPSLKPLLHKDQTVPGAFGEEHAADEAGVSMDPETLREIAKAHARIGWADFPLEDTRVVEADSEDLSDFSTVPSYEEEIVSLVESPRAAIREPRLEQAINPDSDGEIGFESAGSDSEFEAPARGLPVRESVGYAAVDPTTAEARDDLPEHFALNSDAAVHGLLADPSLHHRRMKEQLFGKQKGLNLPVVGTMRSSAHRIHNVRTTNLFMAYRMQTVLSQLQVDKSTMIKAMSVPMRRTTLREILDMAEAAQSGDAAASPPLDADEESAAIARNITESKINLELRPALAGYLDSNFEYRTSEELQEDLLGFTRWDQAAPHMADGELPKEPRSKIKDDDLSDDEPAALESLSRRFHSIPALLRAPPGLMTHRERVDRIMTLMPASVLSEAFQLRMLQLLRENVTSVTLSRQEGETEESPTFHVDGDTARRIREQLAEEFSDAFDRVEADAIQALRVRYSLREHEMLQELGAPVESLLDDANEPVDSDEEYGAAEAKDADVAFAKEAAAGAAEDDATEAAAEAAAAGKEPPAAPAVKELDHFAKELIEKHISSVHRVMVERGVQDGKNYVRDKHRRWTLMQLQGVDALLDRLEEELESPAGQHDLKVDMEPDDAMVTAAAAGHDVPHFLAGSVDIEHMPWELDATLAPDHANELRKRALRETRQAIADRDVLGSEFGVSDVRDDPVFSEAALSEELRYFRPHHLFHDRQGDALETPGTMVPTSELKDRADRVRAASRLARDRAVTSAQLAERPWEAPLVPMRPSPTGRGLEPAPGTPALLVDDGIDLAEDTAIQAAIFANNIPLARRMLEKRRIRLEREAPDVVDRYDVEANFHANMLGMVAQDDLRSSESESDSGKRISRDSLFSDDDEHDFLFDAEEPDTAAAPFEGAAADFAASDAEADSDGARR
ncbi:hypothetical protein FNF29_06827 [Cafeteria roenbergensis]|uniref:Uncharacterized protein n=1 Tax=Cafeteria roenbergensis TaxID=33653 RepID=A0A5A8C5L6_CAFRO|nr:hypothetical protein FNF29_06827 [Cafeteria roenbergensis]|eukprot:KAA0148168.1 hypothetical protein FNF29_06827 [Cafeteria roenbergensis]